MTQRIGDLINAQERTELHQAIDAALEHLRFLREIEEMGPEEAYQHLLAAEGLVARLLYEMDMVLASKVMR